MIQKKVFGAGYPSLPTMTIEEFYEQKVQDGTFQIPGSGGYVSMIELQDCPYHWFMGFRLWCFMPLSTIFQLFHGGQFYFWRNSECPEKTTDQPLITLSHNVVTSTPRHDSWHEQDENSLTSTPRHDSWHEQDENSLTSTPRHDSWHEQDENSLTSTPHHDSWHEQDENSLTSTPRHDSWHEQDANSQL